MKNEINNDIAKSIKKFKSYTAKELLALLQKYNVKTILDQLAFYKKVHKQEITYQVWQEGMQPKLIQTEAMMMEKINYIHNNPIKKKGTGNFFPFVPNLCACENADRNLQIIQNESRK